MKSFFVSLTLSATICLALWQFGRQETARLRASAGTAVPPISSGSQRPGLVPPGELWKSLERSQRGREFARDLTAEQWVALDALPNEEIVARVKTLKPDKNDLLWRAAAFRWASFDGPAAMAYAKDQHASHPHTDACGCCGGDPGEQYEQLVGEVFDCWLRHDPYAALASGVALGRSEVASVWESPSETLAQTDFTKALDVLATLHGVADASPQHGAELFFSISANGRNPEPDCLGSQLDDPARQAEFVRWLKNCRDPKLACGVFSRVFSGTRSQGAWLRPDRLPGYTPCRDQFPTTLEDPNTAKVMGALALGANPLVMLESSDWVGDCVSAWAFRDPESAGVWLAAQPLSREFDPALIAFAEGVWQHSPEAAVRWSGRISRPGTRLRDCAKYYPRWHLRDPKAAEAWLENAGFPEVHRLYIAGK